MTVQPTPEPTPRTDAEVVGAIRLAMEAGSDGRARLKVICAILARAAATEAGDTGSVWLLIDAIKDAGAELRVTDSKPRGRIRRRGAVSP